MKRMALAVLLLFCLGCVSVKVPRYLTDRHPYKKTFFASFDDTMSAARAALENSGWRIAEITDPAVFEQNRAGEGSGKQALIFTDTRQTSMILFSRYTTLNIYVRLSGDSTEVEMRYLAVAPLFFKRFESYRNDHLASQIFNLMARRLEQ